MLLKPVLLSLIGFASAAVHERLASPPPGWLASREAVASDQKINFRIALSYSNVESLEQMLKEVSTPQDPSYGNYLSLEEVKEAFAPSREAQTKVRTWLQNSGASKVEIDDSLVHFTTTVEKASELLNASFHYFTDGATKKLRTLEYSIPDEFSDNVDFIEPTTFFGSSKSYPKLPSFSPSTLEDVRKIGNSRSKRQSLAACNTPIEIHTSNETNEYDLVGPECLKELYNVGNYTADQSRGSTIAFANFLNQSANYQDLMLYEEFFEIPEQNFTVLALINGGVDNQDPITQEAQEANLDVQNIVGVTNGALPVGSYITAGKPPFVPDLLSPTEEWNFNEPYLQYYQYLLSQPDSDLPWVISHSYGDHENTVPERYARRICNMMGMMGLRGRTIVHSTGDEGVGAVCRANHGDMHPEFTTFFPASCPYVTAVGGTQFFDPVEAWNASSGGFSLYFPTAWYQKDTISTYLESHISASTKKYYTSNDYVDFEGRAYPDVAAHSLYPYYLYFRNGTARQNGGTSAAAPVVAAIVALLNDARFGAGKPAMGFINPWLYTKAAAGSAFHDVAVGGALGCNGVDLQNGLEIPQGGHIPYASWNATVGWDPATGLGTLNFEKLRAICVGEMW